MRSAIIAAAPLFVISSFAYAQDSKQQHINAAIDAAERICLVGNRYRFEADASGALTISKFLPGGEAKIIVDHAEAKGSQFFDNEVIRREVDSDIRECMKSQWPTVLTVIEVPPPQLPDYTTGWIDGEGQSTPHYCDPRRDAYAAKYPDYNIEVQYLPEQHSDNRDAVGIKHDKYMYSCSFSASKK